MTNFLKELSKNKEYFCMAVIILLLVYLFCNTCNKENLVMTGSSGNNMSQVLGLNSNNEIVLSENLSNVSTIPVGTILMWSPRASVPINTNTPTNPPKGWYVCNGQQPKAHGNTYYTPDLTDSFIKGVTHFTKADQTIPKATVTLQVSDLPDHSHNTITHCSGNNCQFNGGGGYGQWGTTGSIYDTNNPKSTKPPNQTPIKIPDPLHYTVVFIIKVF